MATTWMALALAMQAPVQTPSALPSPTQDPLALRREQDAVIALSRSSIPMAEFADLVRGAIDRAPAVAETRASIDIAEAQRDEARSGLFPIVDIRATSQHVISREFSDDPFNFLERRQPANRQDVLANVSQMLFDFGSTANRVAAAGARMRSAAYDTEAAADRIALQSVAAWYEVFAYRALVALGEAFAQNQDELRDAIRVRVQSGASAPGDIPRVDSYIASATTELARYRRLRSSAEERFEQLFGRPAPLDLGRAPPPPVPTMTKDAAQFLARSSPAVSAADALARASRRDAKAERAANLPNVAVGVDASKYGIDEIDYDLRGRVTIRQRLFGPGDARADQAEARAASAEARATRIRTEAERDAAIAWTDVRALEGQLASLETNYFASRQSRDVLAERFRVARGTLFELLESESGYFSVAASYIRTITELDAARYVLLSRTGKLLPTLGIAPIVLERK